MIASRFRIVSTLGEGGMGTAYRAWDIQQRVPVVVKVPKRSLLLEDPQFAKRFAREIRTMAAVHHPHVVPIVDWGEDAGGEFSGVPYVVMRFLPGGSLTDRRQRDAEGNPRANHPSTLSLWLPGIASALDAVHSVGIVHRDVKPDNIFFDGFWQSFLGDFGIAKRLQDAASTVRDETLSGTNMSIGTPPYMSPEQFSPKHALDGRSDQYALAVTVYEMLCGTRPFTGETTHIAVEHLTHAPPPLGSRLPNLSPSLCAAVHRGLAKHPSERFSSCSEFAAAVLAHVTPMEPEANITWLLCPACSNILKLPLTAGGRSGKCPRCQTVMNVAKDLGALWLPSEEEGIAAVAGGDPKPILPFTAVSSVGQGWRWPRVDPTVLGVAWAASAVTLLVVGYLLGSELNTGSLKKQLALAQQGGQQEKAAREQAESELKKLVAQQTQSASERQKLEDENERLTAELAMAQELQEKATVAMEEMEQKLAMRAAAPPVAPPAAPLPAAPLPAVPIPAETQPNGIGMEMKLIPAGKFQMGEVGSAVAVTLTRPFWLGKTEVTQGQWEQVMGTKPWPAGQADANLPATNVNWTDVTDFCKKLTQRERGNGELAANEEYRLPTEAEWEYACRAGTTTKYSFGDDESKLGDFAWFSGNSGNAVHKVGTKQANPWGLDDMHGNILEWCSDWYGGKLAGGADPAGPVGGSNRVFRGGGWWFNPVYCRSAYRNGIDPSTRSGDLGFRVARSQSVQ